MIRCWPMFVGLPALLRLALAFALVAGTAPMAPALGPTMQVEVCSGTGTVLLTLDAEGNPVAATAPCPACMMAGLAVIPVPPVVAGVAEGWRAVAMPAVRVPAPKERPGLNRARGPPGVA